MSEQRTGFMGTYFDKNAILRLSRWSEVLAWVVTVVYAVDLLLAIGVFALQYARGFWSGLGITDIFTTLIYTIERPFRGAVYFVILMAISKGILILMEMEDSLRRSVRVAEHHH